MNEKYLLERLKSIDPKIEPCGTAVHFTVRGRSQSNFREICQHFRQIILSD